MNVPVQLLSAVRDLDYHFHQLHEKDKVPIEQRRFCSKEGAAVTWEEVAHAYDLDGKQVVITDEELTTGWHPDRYRDCCRERLERVIEAKRKRKTIEMPTPEKEPSPVPDLMDALERTLARLRNGEELRGEEPAADRGNGSPRGGASRRRSKSSR